MQASNVSNEVVGNGRMQSPTDAPPEAWWRLSSGVREPAMNMAVDEALLEVASGWDCPVFRTYGWDRPAATFGYFQRFSEVAAMVDLRPLIRRPTGGGVVPHDTDWTYSVVVPPVHAWYRLSAVESYQRMHRWLQAAFGRMEVHTELADCCDPRGAGQCFVGADRYDLLCSGRKIAGAAQRRNRHGLLIQGSVQPPRSSLARMDWESAMMSVANVQWSPFVVDPALEARIGELAAGRYALPSYNEKR